MVAAHTSGPLADGGPIPTPAVDACRTEYSDDDAALVFTFRYRGQGPGSPVGSTPAVDAA